MSRVWLWVHPFPHRRPPTELSLGGGNPGASEQEVTRFFLIWTSSREVGLIGRRANRGTRNPPCVGELRIRGVWGGSPNELWTLQKVQTERSECSPDSQNVPSANWIAELQNIFHANAEEEEGSFHITPTLRQAKLKDDKKPPGIVRIIPENSSMPSRAENIEEGPFVPSHRAGLCQARYAEKAHHAAQDAAAKAEAADAADGQFRAL
ncbi:hypothetical protein B0H11DRAFT_1921202 [Mycena galericulata]|nr:hypothetical protein B0H11DRAFT_1921202 [Mycena galericulata]